MDDDYGIWNPDSHQIKEDNKRIGFPLDSHIDYDKDGNPVFDRAIASAPLRTLFKGLLTDGVSPDASRIDADITSDSFKVSAGEEMSVVVNKGFAICGGCLKYNEASETLPISAATDKARIDTVVLRLDDNDSVRSCELYVVEGVPGTTPKRPDLTRNGSKWEIGLADVYVTANSTQISNSKITDTRLESERCGIISAIDSIDTSRFFAQIEADLEYFKDHYEKDFSDWSAEQQSAFESWSDGEEEIFTNWSSEMREEYETWSDRQKADFIVWFNNLQVILDENVAARLTAEVEALKTKDTEIEGQISDLSDDVDERISEVEQKIEEGIPTKTSDLINDGIGDGTSFPILYKTFAEFDEGYQMQKATFPFPINDNDLIDAYVDNNLPTLSNYKLYIAQMKYYPDEPNSVYFEIYSSASARQFKEPIWVTLIKG